MGDVSGPDSTPIRVEVIDLSLGWSFKQTDDVGSNSWLPVKKIPSTVQQDLIDNKKLADPFIGFNEIKAEWVGLKSWTYRVTIARPSLTSTARAVLAFDGLDTFATVKLRGKTILESDNMFLPHRVDVTDLVHGAEENLDLEIEFASAFLRAREIKEQHPNHKFIAFNGDTARLAVRKAQYHWGWDWGPLLVCAGVWRPVRLEIYSVRIAELRTDVKIADDYKAATVTVSLDVEAHAEHRHLTARLTIKLGDTVIDSVDTDIGANGKVSGQLKVHDPELWMPNGYGKQTLYTVSASILHDATELHTESKRIGIRDVQLVQEPDSHGKSFYFRINGVDVFCGGSCWIPADSFLTNVTPEKYRAWLELMVPANQKMIRYGR